MGFDINGIGNVIPNFYDENVFKIYVDKCLNVINNVLIDKYPRINVVGDIHGSIIQLFSPLVRAQLIKNVKYDFVRDEFKFDVVKPEEIITSDYSEESESEESETSKTSKIKPDYVEIIYTGDLIYRGCHAHLMAMIEALIKVCELFPKNVHWCFGNHDIDFVGIHGVPRYVLNNYRKVCPRFNEIYNKFITFAFNNPDILIYKNDKYSLAVSHTIQTREGVAKAMDLYNSEKQIQSFSIIDNNIAESLNNMVKLILRDVYKSVEYDTHAYYDDILHYLYWYRPNEVDKNDIITYDCDNHFVGHTPCTLETLSYFNTFVNKHHSIYKIDTNTPNDEYSDNCLWISIVNVSNHYNMKIIEYDVIRSDTCFIVEEYPEEYNIVIMKVIDELTKIKNICENNLI